MKPLNIFIVRHGQSEGNADTSKYITTPDHAIQLTEKGRDQAREAGIQLFSKTIGAQQPYMRHSVSWAVYYSPFVRSIQTTEGIIKGYNSQCGVDYTKISKQVSLIREEPRIREQEWHARMPPQDADKKDLENLCKQYSKFYYRFESGESCADVYDRVSDFMNTLHRDFNRNTYPMNVLLVSHGLAIRVFLMRWFHITVAEFDTWANPKNGEIFHLRLNSKNKYDFDFASLRTEIPAHNYSYTLNID
jgi:broad specificity phosphatase PhoE